MNSRNRREADPVDVHLGGALKSWAEHYSPPLELRARLLTALYKEALSQPKRRFYLNLSQPGPNYEYPELNPAVFISAVEHYFKSTLMPVHVI